MVKFRKMLPTEVLIVRGLTRVGRKNVVCCLNIKLF